MIKRILVLLAFVVSIAANSQVVDSHSNDLWKITRDYLQAFEQMDFDKMGTFLHDSVQFFDIGSQATGKKNVIDIWKKTFTPRPLRIQFDIREHFVSGSFVVLDMRYEVVNVVEGKKVLLNIEVISVLQFRDGKIILLHDYPDFTAYGRQLASQLENKKPDPMKWVSEICQQHCAITKRIPDGMLRPCPHSFMTLLSSKT